MKKLFAIVFAILCVLVFFGCEKTTDNVELVPNRITFMGYIQEVQNGKITIDAIEWVTVPGERADELGITNADAPNGFTIYNAESAVDEYNIADSCEIHILDWYNNYEPKQVDLAGFNDILEQRSGLPIPYTVTIENGSVVSIEEHYIP